jgi:hypothetical protein
VLPIVPSTSASAPPSTCKNILHYDFCSNLATAKGRSVNMEKLLSYMHKLVSSITKHVNEFEVLQSKVARIDSLNPEELQEVN